MRYTFFIKYMSVKNFIIILNLLKYFTISLPIRRRFHATVWNTPLLTRLLSWDVLQIAQTKRSNSGLPRDPSETEHTIYVLFEDTWFQLFG